MGEACHIYDLFTFLVGAKVATVDATALAPTTAYYRRDENFVATMRFEDGSVATLSYTALGNPAFPKETLDVFCDGAVATIEDFRAVRVHGHPSRGYESKGQEKGLREEFRAFYAAVRAGAEWPIPLWQQIQSSEIAFAVQDRLS
jgi:predicted dehydrogenase